MAVSRSAGVERPLILNALVQNMLSLRLRFEKPQKQYRSIFRCLFMHDRSGKSLVVSPVIAQSYLVLVIVISLAIVHRPCSCHAFKTDVHA